MSCEQVINQRDQLLSDGNGAGLTRQEATAWALQVAYSKLSSKFGTLGEFEKAEVARRRAALFYEDWNLDYSRAGEKITAYLEQTSVK